MGSGRCAEAACWGAAPRPGLVQGNRGLMADTGCGVRLGQDRASGRRERSVDQQRSLPSGAESAIHLTGRHKKISRSPPRWVHRRFSPERRRSPGEERPPAPTNAHPAAVPGKSPLDWRPISPLGAAQPRELGNAGGRASQQFAYRRRHGPGRQRRDPGPPLAGKVGGRRRTDG